MGPRGHEHDISYLSTWLHCRLDRLLRRREAARWMLHCHHMPHLATGMMTELRVSA